MPKTLDLKENSWGASHIFESFLRIFIICCTAPIGYKERGEYVVFSFQVGTWKSIYKTSAVAENRKECWQRYSL